MFIGFPPSSYKSFYLDYFQANEFLVIAIEAAEKLQWKVNLIRENGFDAFFCTPSGRVISEINFNIHEGQARITSRSQKGILDLGRNSKNIRKFSEQIIDLKYDLKPENIKSRWEEIRARIQADTDKDGASESDNNKPGFISLLVPRKGYVVVPVLIYINILLFLAQVLSGVSFINPEIEQLLNWGGNFRPATFNGQWWRLLTNCFLHIGVIHLLMNMYALLYIGLLLESLIGSRRFAYAYLLTGILASVTSVFWHPNTVSAGASGAIFGMYGVFVALLTTNLVEKSVRKEQLTSMLIFIVYNLAYGLKGGIDNAAHLGGLVSGIIMGLTYYPFLRKPELKMRNILIHGSTVITMAVLSFVFLSGLKDPVSDYIRITEGFAMYEQKAMSLYHLPQNTSDSQYLRVVETDGLPNWEKCRILIDSAGRIEGLPDNLVERNALLKRYCDYRIMSYNIIRTAIKENSDSYRPVIEQYNQKIELILKKLGGENIPDSELEIKTDVPQLNTVNQSGLIVLDGRIVQNIDSVDQKDIKEINILQAEQAKELYGEKGINGAVIINTWEGQP